MNNRLQTFTLILVCLTLLAYILVVARNLLIPLIVAVFLWYLLNTVAKSIRNMPIVGHYVPFSICLTIAIFILIYLLYQLGAIITNNVNEVIVVAPRYQENFIKIMQTIDTRFHIKVLANVNEWVANVDVRNILLSVYSVFTVIASNALLIMLYMSFLFLEQQVMQLKLKALCPQKKHFDLVTKILSQIVDDTQTYLGLKSLLSLMTAFGGWLLMKAVGLDFAEFWALLIFFLNFIPNIGAIIATLFPAMLAMVQFQTWPPFLVVTLGITTIQFIVGNILEPRFMGKSLNLSPLVILIALAFWGALWGILGMFLSVPITVMMMIIFSHFEKTKGIAVLLSETGSIRTETK